MSDHPLTASRRLQRNVVALCAYDLGTAYMDAAVELDRHRYLSLATFRSTGALVQTPVWFAAADGKLFVFTGGDSGKVKRLRRASRARISPCDARGNVNGPWRDVTARIVTDPSVIARASAAMRTKYGWQARLLDLFSWLTGRIQRRAWIEIEM